MSPEAFDTPPDEVGERRADRDLADELLEVRTALARAERAARSQAHARRLRVSWERARANAAERELRAVRREWEQAAARAAKVEPVADRLAHWARVNGFDADDPIELLRAAAAFRTAAEKAAARGVLTPYARMAHGAVDGWEQGCRCYGCAVAWKQAGRIV